MSEQGHRVQETKSNLKLLARENEHEAIVHEPLVIGLILVLKPQLRTDFRRAEIQADFLGLGVDLLAGSAFLEAEFGDRHDHEVKVDFLFGHSEGGLAQDVVGVVTDPYSIIFEVTTEAVGVGRTDAKLDGLKDLQLDR